ncbi:MAG: V-type ATP synthase subunit A [Spirochaetes bacterium]|nr:V-type ATP synthase subunit A [Spirochaetota bacterium]
MKKGRIIKVAGPLVIAENIENARMYDVVEVGEEKLIGEIVELRGNLASIQVYEETGGLGVGDPVVTTGEPLSVELGPGLIESIFDGIQRPLDKLMEKSGDTIKRGLKVASLDVQKKWDFKSKKSKEDQVMEGDILGEVKETVLVKHRVMVPIGLKGKIKNIREGSFTITDVIATIEDEKGKSHDVSMVQRWPVRQSRLYENKKPPYIPLITGQRVIDAFFPVAKGGTACVPGPFGSGKTVIQHQLAKWADAEIIVYIGCGERGNEMTDVLMEFPELKDPRSGEPLMKRTVLIANTSNMPVAAREASVYTGVTIAEYFRDMGYSVAVMADSTSRWAEAMREMSGRLEEMPGDEGYPAYLGRRIAEFYERAGRIECLGKDKREGALTIIGAVSPPGGDLSDPVVQATLRVVKVFWSLEDKLAYKRHFPAINWLTSYTLYENSFDEFYRTEFSEDWRDLLREAMRILQIESELEEIVRLVGLEALSQENRLIMETARSIREDFLHQNAFHPVDTYTSFTKQYKMIEMILKFHHLAEKAIENKVAIHDISQLPVKEKIAQAKFIKEDNLDEIDKIKKELEKIFEKLEEEKRHA